MPKVDRALRHCALVMVVMAPIPRPLINQQPLLTPTDWRQPLGQLGLAWPSLTLQKFNAQAGTQRDWPRLVIILTRIYDVVQSQCAEEVPFKIARLAVAQLEGASRSHPQPLARTNALPRSPVALFPQLTRQREPGLHRRRGR